MWDHIWFLKEADKNFATGIVVRGSPQECFDAAEPGKTYVIQPSIPDPRCDARGGDFGGLRWVEGGIKGFKAGGGRWRPSPPFQERLLTFFVHRMVRMRENACFLFYWSSTVKQTS